MLLDLNGKIFCASEKYKGKFIVVIEIKSKVFYLCRISAMHNIVFYD